MKDVWNKMRNSVITGYSPPSRLLSKDSSVMNDEKKENKSFEGVSFMMMDFDNGRNLGRSN